MKMQNRLGALSDIPVLTTKTTAPGHLNSDITMVRWPQADAGSNLTSSPIMDTVARTTSELQQICTQQISESLAGQQIATTASKQRRGKQSMQPGPSASDYSGIEEIMNRLSALEGENVGLFTAVKERITFLKEENTVRKAEIAVLNQAYRIGRGDKGNNGNSYW
ncbi:hypothetical protein BDZ97DRAFT_86200 [Flammula alnicola]|nr:hypothetical protein BDZ97DRAFT_86200 [Flammula alnicola]